MNVASAHPDALPEDGRRRWRGLQAAVWALGAGVLLALFLRPASGIHAFWNVLIPIAPALVAIAPGVWRNVCPMGLSALIPRRIGLSRRRRIRPQTQDLLGLIGIAALLLIIPLRHVILDLNGPATALTIILVSSIGVGAGLIFDWKSGWCSGLCPIHPVEKLYGQRPGISPPNAHCAACANCVAPCPDSTPPETVEAGPHRPLHHLGRLIMVGGFAGYIWGWFHVPDAAQWQGWGFALECYAWPFLGLMGSLLLYLILWGSLSPLRRPWLVRSFAAAAIACYYWFRLPALFGFAPFPGDGMLIDLRASAPPWFPMALRCLSTLFFAWWLILRRAPPLSWSLRPRFAALDRQQP